MRGEPLVRLVILGELASKANSRRMVFVNGRRRIIKSAKALTFLEAAAWQVIPLKALIEGEICAEINIFYASERNDLDEALVLDCLQGKLYKNDRQVRERHVYHHIDRKNPRVTVALYRR